MIVELLASTLLLTAAGHPDTGTTLWSWNGAIPSGAQIRVELVRGSIRVEPSPEGRARLEVRLTGLRSDPRTVRVVLERTGARLLVRAVYSSYGAGPAGLPRDPGTGRQECLPPDPRGDFWHSDVRTEMILHAPSDARLDLSLLEGPVSRVPGHQPARPEPGPGRKGFDRKARMARPVAARYPM